MTMLRCTCLAFLGLALTTGSLPAQTPPAAPSPATAPPAADAPEPMQEPQTGDHWTYEFRDEITGEIKSTITSTVTDISATEIGMRTRALGNANTGYQTYDRSWDLTNNGIWRFTPNDGTGIQAPLEAGKTWTFKGSDLNSTAGVSWKRSGTSKVVAQERVTTRAGTFDTFKIETSIQIQNANDPTKKMQAVQQTWYAPVIDHWVKRTTETRSEGRVHDKNTIELVEYGRD
jgi:hypothetical protein